MVLSIERYVVFFGDRHYPLGGARDRFRFEEDLDVAKGLAQGWTENDSLRWSHVFDLTTKSIVFSGSRPG